MLCLVPILLGLLMHIKLLAAGLLKEIILVLKGFFGRVLFGKQVILSLRLVGANIETIRKYIERQREK